LNGNQNPLSDRHYRPLPAEAVRLCEALSAPPRLVAHLILVHDFASRLMERLGEAFPGLTFDREAVLFGAATHDLGKTVYRDELIASGHKHQERGVEVLRSMGVPEEKARFAYTHGNWEHAENATLEDLLVALSDKCWKGKRIEKLESMTVSFISSATGEPEWTCFAKLDEILMGLAQDADARLAWQAGFAS
jgi:putative nucleotidyltransferase with HDIG domain